MRLDHREADTATTAVTSGVERTTVHRKREVSSCPRRMEVQEDEERDST